MKYEVSLYNDFGEPNIIVVNTAKGSYLEAIRAEIDSHYDNEEDIFEIRVKRIDGG